MKAILTSNTNGERIAAHLTTDHPIAFGKDKWIDAYGKEITYDGNEVWVDGRGDALCRRGEEAPAFAVEQIHEYIVRAENGPKHYEGESAIEAVRTALWLMGGKDAVNAVVTCDGITVDNSQLFGLLSPAEVSSIKEPEYRVEDTETGNAVFYEGTSALEAVKAALEAMDGEDGFTEVDVYKDDERVFCGATDAKGDLFGLLTTQETVGDNIAAARHAAGMSQQDLADKTGLRQATIADIETGKSDCRISTLQTIAVALDCDIADLFE